MLAYALFAFLILLHHSLSTAAVAIPDALNTVIPLSLPSETPLPPPPPFRRRPPSSQPVGLGGLPALHRGPHPYSPTFLNNVGLAINLVLSKYPTAELFQVQASIHQPDIYLPDLPASSNPTDFKAIRCSFYASPSPTNNKTIAISSNIDEWTTWQPPHIETVGEAYVQTLRQFFDPFDWSDLHDLNMGLEVVMRLAGSKGLYGLSREWHSASVFRPSERGGVGNGDGGRDGNGDGRRGGLLWHRGDIEGGQILWRLQDFTPGRYDVGFIVETGTRRASAYY